MNFVPTANIILGREENLIQTKDLKLLDANIGQKSFGNLFLWR